MRATPEMILIPCPHVNVTGIWPGRDVKTVSMLFQYSKKAAERLYRNMISDQGESPEIVWERNVLSE